MRRIIPSLAACLCVWLFLAEPQLSEGSGFRVFDHGGSGAGQSNAFTAQADDASAIYYNPAGLTQLRHAEFYGGFNFFGGGTTYTSPTGTQAHGDFGGAVLLPPTGDIYIAVPIPERFTKDKLVVGIGLVGPPFGVKYRWPNDGPFNTTTVTASLPLLDIKPTVAYQLTDSLSVGVGMDIYTFSSFIGEGQYEQKFVGSGPLAGQQVEVNGSDTSLGFNLSLMYTPQAFMKTIKDPITEEEVSKPQVSIGLVYRSQATLHLNGNLLVNGAAISSASTTAVLPQVLTAGVGIWPIREANREWKLEMDVDYTGWKSLRNINLNTPAGTTPVPLNWRSTFAVMMGTEYKFINPDWLHNWDVALRTGYWFAQTSVPDATFNPAVPDADSHLISVGAGALCKGGGKFLGIWECGPRARSGIRPSAWGLDIAYQALIYEQRTITGNNNPTLNGLYSTVYHIGSVYFRILW
jgi:long-chain fatty acid transport protein